MTPRSNYRSHDGYFHYHYHYRDEDTDSIGAGSGWTESPSITAYHFENGRRYHAYREGQYWGPNDEKSKTHETIMHHLWLLTLDDALFLAPVENPKYVLDVGTGIGLWAENFADRYPNADVLGTDLSPIQTSFPAPNLHFEMDDACSLWTYPPNHFSYIHVRGLFGSISDWPFFYHQCNVALEAGTGYLEHAEISCIPVSADEDKFPLDKDNIFARWGELTRKIGREAHVAFELIDDMKQGLEDAGFVDVVEARFVWPVGDWGDYCEEFLGAETSRTKKVFFDTATATAMTTSKLSELGRWNQKQWLEGMEGWILAIMTRKLGWSVERVRNFVDETKSAFADMDEGESRTSQRCLQQICVVYGRKPEARPDPNQVP